MHEICHIEFDVTDIARSRSFFEGLFGWQFKEFMDTMVVFGTGDKHIGGLQQVETVSPGSSPSIWFDVESVDALLAKAQSLGGTILKQKAEVPTVGWSAVLADPDGNPIGIVEFAK